jgi:hypothetical protein
MIEKKCSGQDRDSYIKSANRNIALAPKQLSAYSGPHFRSCQVIVCGMYFMNADDSCLRQKANSLVILSREASMWVFSARRRLAIAQPEYRRGSMITIY